jgi:hypothetical protein
MTTPMARVAITPRPGVDPIEYAVEIEPDRIAARYRSVVDTDHFFTVVDAAIVDGALEAVHWHGQCALVWPIGLRHTLMSRLRSLAAEHSPQS